MKQEEILEETINRITHWIDNHHKCDSCNLDMEIKYILHQIKEEQESEQPNLIVVPPKSKLKKHIEENLKPAFNYSQVGTDLEEHDY